MPPISMTALPFAGSVIPCCCVVPSWIIHSMRPLSERSPEMVIFSGSAAVAITAEPRARIRQTSRVFMVLVFGGFNGSRAPRRNPAGTGGWFRDRSFPCFPGLAPRGGCLVDANIK